MMQARRVPPTNSPVEAMEWLRFVVDKEAACVKRVLSPVGKSIG